MGQALKKKRGKQKIIMKIIIKTRTIHVRGKITTQIGYKRLTQDNKSKLN